MVRRHKYVCPHKEYVISSGPSSTCCQPNDFSLINGRKCQKPDMGGLRIHQGLSCRQLTQAIAMASRCAVRYMTQNNHVSYGEEWEGRTTYRQHMTPPISFTSYEQRKFVFTLTLSAIRYSIPAVYIWSSEPFLEANCCLSRPQLEKVLLAHACRVNLSPMPQLHL